MLTGATAAKDSASGGAGRHSTARSSDAWFGVDKVKHFLIAGFVESVGFATLQAIGAGRSASVGTATVGAVAASIGREIHDRRTKGLFSVRDLVWDGLGITGALLIAGHTQR